MRTKFILQVFRIVEISYKVLL